MKKEKRNAYISHLYAAVHTLSVRLDYFDMKKANNHKLVKKAHVKQTGDETYYYCIFNANKVYPTSMIKSYSEFEEVIDSIYYDIEAINWGTVTRADLCLNSDYDNDFELFKKLNRLIICCIAEAYNINNYYQSQDLWSYRNLSVAIKSDTIEAENYNKFLESHGQVDTKNRLELRSKRINADLKELRTEFTIKWFERLDNAVEQFKNVQAHYNKELVRIWREDVVKPKKERDFLNSTAFLMAYKDCIFTRKQLENLIAGAGIAENPKAKARKFKERHQIEFYSKKDLQIVIKAIKKTILEYFNNPNLE